MPTGWAEWWPNTTWREYQVPRLMKRKKLVCRSGRGEYRRKNINTAFKHGHWINRNRCCFLTTIKFAFGCVHVTLLERQLESTAKPIARLFTARNCNVWNSLIRPFPTQKLSGLLWHVIDNRTILPIKRHLVSSLPYYTIKIKETFKSTWQLCITPLAPFKTLTHFSTLRCSFFRYSDLFQA